MAKKKKKSKKARKPDRSAKAARREALVKVADASLARYPHFVVGSVHDPEDGSGKLRAEIVCQVGKCRRKRQVYTSDVFQVKRCIDHKSPKFADSHRKQG